MIGRRQILASALLLLGSGAAHAADAGLLKRFGAPKTRIQGGTRSVADKPAPMVLLSEETALAATAQPDLYWFLSRASGLRIDLSLTPVGAAAPVLQQVMKRGAGAGVHRLALAEQGVSLDPSTDYVFAATLVPDPTMRTADLSARGTLRYQPHAGFDDARAAAAEGYWIDAFDLADPATRALLLDEVGLSPAANWLRQPAG
ncbi:DUF928 domain-containing protein [Geminicoccus roseus]|uniref:DUF928 domain-containing protein n=1 Tax=Geminicoccus roseus TaxID=404900 RepID=UPI000429E717|nr:DUF928 domain-containing protein [Geminicoccus roseus]